MNIELLDKIIDWAVCEELAERDTKDVPKWDQTVWGRGEVDYATPVIASMYDAPLEGYALQVDCGSSFCLAGNICAQAGDTFVVTEYDAQFARQYSEPALASYVLPKGKDELQFVSARACQLLEVDSVRVYDPDWDFHRDLFDGENDIYAVLKLATLLAQREGHDRDYSTQYEEQLDKALVGA